MFSLVVQAAQTFSVTGHVTGVQFGSTSCQVLYLVVQAGKADVSTCYLAGSADMYRAVSLWATAVQIGKILVLGPSLSSPPCSLS